jgi:hypothetical protein
MRMINGENKMRKFFTLFFLTFSSMSLGWSATTDFSKLKTILNPNTGRPDYIINTASTSLSDLFGVSTRTVTGAQAADGDVITFNQWSTSGTWIPRTPTGGGGGGGGSGIKSFMDSAAGVSLSSMNMLSSQFIRTTQGSSATFVLNPASVTLQGNTISISSVDSGLQTLYGSFNSFTSTTQAISISTANLFNLLTASAVADSNFWRSANSTMSALSLSTAALQVSINAFANFGSSTNARIDHLYTWVPSTFALVNTATTSMQGNITALNTSTTAIANRPSVIVMNQSASRKGDASALDISGTAVTSFVCAGTTCTLVLDAGTGGSGTAVAGVIFNGSQMVTYSTLAVPGATIISGAGISSFTWTPQIFSTWTYFITFASTAQALDLAQNTTIYSLSIATANTFINLQSTAVSLSQNWTSTLSTWNAFATFASTTQTQVTALISTITSVGISTQNIQFVFAGFASTSDLRGNTFVNFRSTSDNLFNTVISTLMQVRTDTGTLLSQIVTLNSTMTFVRLATSTIENRLSTTTLIYNAGIALTAFVQGANITLTQSGSSLTIAGSAGGGSGPTPSIAIGTGTTRGSSIISSNTVATVIFSEQNFRTQLVDATTTFITLSTAPKTFSMVASFDGGGSALTASSSSVVIIPFESTITSFTILSPIQSGEVRARVMSASFANFPTFTNVCSANCPSISGATQKVTDSTLTGWNRNVTGGDIFMVSVDTAATSITSLTVQINMVRR